MQYKNLNIPVRKNKYQHKNIYFSTKKYLFQYKNIYFSTKKYFNPKIFISVPKNISIQKYLFQYNKKIFQKVQTYPKCLCDSSAEGKWVFQNGGFEWIFKKKEPLITLRNYKYETILAFLERFHDIRTSMRTRKITGETPWEVLW